MVRAKFKATVIGEIKIDDVKESDHKEFIKDRLLEELNARFKLVVDAFNADVKIELRSLNH